MRIEKSKIILYQKTNEYNMIRISINTKEKINIAWYNYKNISRLCQKKKQNIIDNLKINGCAICGYNICNAALEFHHVIDYNKDFEIKATSLFKFPNELFIKEMNKCILLCSNCHREVHHQ